MYFNGQDIWWHCQLRVRVGAAGSGEAKGVAERVYQCDSGGALVTSTPQACNLRTCYGATHVASCVPRLCSSSLKSAQRHVLSRNGCAHGICANKPRARWCGALHTPKCVSEMRTTSGQWPRRLQGAHPRRTCHETASRTKSARTRADVERKCRLNLPKSTENA